MCTLDELLGGQHAYRHLHWMSRGLKKKTNGKKEGRWEMRRMKNEGEVHTKERLIVVKLICMSVVFLPDKGSSIRRRPGEATNSTAIVTLLLSPPLKPPNSASPMRACFRCEICREVRTRSTHSSTSCNYSSNKETDEKRQAQP
jgi:hypothetical protein